MAVHLRLSDGSPYWWDSPDIWVVPGTDPNGPPATPTVGQTAYLWARIRSDHPVSDVRVSFWIADPSGVIRRSTANLIGTAFTTVGPDTPEEVLCLVPWKVSLINGGHECIVVEARSGADPLSPPPTDPDILDARTYPQIAQRNLTVVAPGRRSVELLLTVTAGARADRYVELVLEQREAVEPYALGPLGITADRFAGPEAATAALSCSSRCRADNAREPHHERAGTLEVHVPANTSVPVYLTISAPTLRRDEFATVRVLEREADEIVGGVTFVVVSDE